MVLNETDAAFRDEVRSILAGALTDGLRAAGRRCSGIFTDYPEAIRWHRILAQRGWSVPQWPVAHGGTGWRPMQHYLFASELAAADAPPLAPMGTHMVGPVIIAFGTPEQQRRWLPGIRSGADYWAQGYSEPQSGSDLASLQCKVVRDGDEYVISGTKIWTTHAQFANRMFCLVRAVRSAGDEIIVRGSARRTAYAARRALRGSMAPIPLYRIDENGTAHEQGLVNLTCPDGSALKLQEYIEWPLVGAEMVDGWYDGLPYQLLDMRPQGFLGRHFARENAAILQVNEDPRKWSDDDAVHALSLLGSDVPGNFILGAAAYRLWLESVQAPTPVVRDDEVGQRYAELAETSLQHGVDGSSAGGEFPKFTAVRQRHDAAGQLGGEVSHVIVKFSGNDRSEGVQRWSDLLVCEHLATRVMRDELGVNAAETTVHQAFGRTFLEVVRFDRHGRHGRSGLLSLDAVNGALLGANAADWPVTVAKLDALELLAPTALETVSLMWHFGRLIANTDMHEGNLSFMPSAHDVAGLRVAPAYDMVPMLYAPQRGVEVVARNYAPQLPLPGERQAWRIAARAALMFWQMAADDERISTEFRRACSQNRMTLQAVSEHPAAA